MDELLKTIVEAVFSEYGAFVAFLLIVVVKLWFSKEKAEQRNNDLTDKLLTVVESNTKIMTRLVDKIDHQRDIYNAKNP